MKFSKLLVLAFLGMLFFTANLNAQCFSNTPSSPGNITPVEEDFQNGPPECGISSGHRVEDADVDLALNNAFGVNLDGIGGNDVSLLVTVDPTCGQVLTWTLLNSNIVISQVICKGATPQNVYTYATALSTDGNLHCPVNNSGKYADFSHIDFCFQNSSCNLSATATHTDVLCNGGSTGTATISASGGTEPYTGTGTFTGLSAGDHTYTVSDANGCNASVTVSIGEPTALTATATHTDVLCNGGSTGTATITASGGTPPYSGDGLKTGLNAGSHSFTVTDANLCPFVVTVMIGEPPLLVASSTKTDALCFGSSNGSVSVTASGGTPPYTGAPATYNNLPAGPYSYTVSDANGCTATTSGTIGQPAVLTLSATANGGTCWGGGKATANVSGGTPTYTYLWNTIPAQTGAMATGLLPGSYTVVVSDAHSCGPLTATVTVPNPTPCTGNSYSKGGFSATCSGNNGGCYLNNNFVANFPTAGTCPTATGGLYIGSAGRSVRLTTVAKVRTYLGGTGTPGVLAAGDACNPGAPTNTLAAQAVAATLNIKFFNTGNQVYGFAPALGLTENQILADANNMLGGGTSSYGLSFTQITTLLDNINRNYENGANLGKLFCACAPALKAPGATERTDLFDIEGKPGMLSSFPNPFGEETTVEFALANDSKVTLDLYNASGMKVATLFSGNAIHNEKYQVVLDGNNLVSGMYTCRLVTSDNTYIHKLLLIK